MGIFKKWKQQLAAKRLEQLQKDIKNIVTVIEWNGHLYIGYYGTPITKIDDIASSESIIILLDKARKEYFEYKRLNF